MSELSCAFESIGPIQRAAIALPGLTVLAGENDTGKGSEVKDAVARIRSQVETRGDSHKNVETPPPDALRIGQFRLSGEIHRETQGQAIIA